MEYLKNFPYTIIFYEAPHRIKKTLQNILKIFGDREIAIAREISKIHEEICRDKISNLIDIVDEMKGEFVLVVDGNHDSINYNELSVIEHVNLYVEDGISEKEAIKIVAKERNVPKSEIYKTYHMGK